jgi:Fic family protein
MVALKKRKISGKTFYYLGYSYRKNGKVRYREKYLGSEMPKDIENIKKEFLHQVYKENWFVAFEGIKKGYSREQKIMPPEIKKKELEIFAVGFTYNTNRIEGSKLTLKETDALLERGISPKDRPISDIKEAEAHRKVFFEMVSYEKDLSIGIVLKWHRELFENTKSRIAGRVRNYNVYISGSAHVPADFSELPTLLVEFFKWYNKVKAKTHPVELSALVHLKFETIHPFGDGNGRIGRLIMNFILHKTGYPMLDIKYINRGGYYNALEMANVKGNETVFIQWFFRRYLKEHRKYLLKGPSA